MRTVFADTLYWVAIVKPGDPYAPAAREARDAIGPCIVVTTDEVLSEFVTTFSKWGPRFRLKAAQTIRDLLANPKVRVLMQSRESFLRTLERFSNRPDKDYSLTDCSSMNAMEAEGIRDILTHDHHFQQEGFNVLIHSAPSERPR